MRQGYVSHHHMNVIERSGVINGLGGGVLGGPNVLRAQGVGFRARRPFSTDYLLGLGMTWQGTSSDPQVLRLQQQINVILDRIGYEPIAENGILGPATCGALAKFGELGTLSNPNNKIDVSLTGAALPLCDSWTAPTKKGASKPDGYKTTVDPSVNALPWNAKDARANKVQTDLNAQLVTHDYAPIGVTGMLDAPTCGAMRHADTEWGQTWLPAFGANCKAFTAPTKIEKPKQCPEGFVAHEGDCKAIGGTSKASMIAWGVAGALVLGVAAVALKKKGRR